MCRSRLHGALLVGVLQAAFACQPYASPSPDLATSTGGAGQASAGGGAPSSGGSISGGAGGTDGAALFDWGDCDYDPGLRDGIELQLESGDFRSVRELTSLSTWRVRVETLRGIECLVNLQRLELSGKGAGAEEPAIDLAPLADLEALSLLSLYSIRFQHLESLTQLPLSQLSINAAEFGSLDSLVGFERLETLHLVSLAASDLSLLSSFSSLRWLELAHMPVSDLSPLSDLPSLETLILRGLQHSDLRGITNLPRLADLRIEASDFTSFEGIEDVPQLKTLRLDDCELIQSFDGLEACKALESIDVTRLYAPAVIISDIDALGSVPTLKWLSLQNAEVSDISALSSCPALEQLNLEGNHVVDLTPLEGLPIESLWISRNPIVSIEPLGKLAKLQELWMDGLGASSIESLRGLPLKSLYASENNLTDISAIENDELEWLVASDNQIASLPEGFVGGQGSNAFTDLRLNPLDDSANARLESLCEAYESAGVAYVWDDGNCNYSPITR